jgi:hypothetical protein
MDWPHSRQPDSTETWAEGKPAGNTDGEVDAKAVAFLAFKLASDRASG